MTSGFSEGYSFFQKTAGAIAAAFEGGTFGTERATYVGSVEEEISKLEEGVNSFLGNQKSIKQLKGDVAEYYHSGTFNVNAATNRSAHRTFVKRSNEFGSSDITSNFGRRFGLKYGATGEDSAEMQSVSVFQRFKEYKGRGGKDSLEKFLSDRKYTSEDVLNDPIYSGQIRVIPKGQLEEATNWLKRMIATEGARRPEQVKRYQNTLKMLTDRVSDNEGNESITLTKEQAEELARLAKEGKFDAKEFADISAPELLSMEMLVKASLKAGMTAAVISIVLKVGPEIFKSVDYLIKNGEIDSEQFKEIGFAAVTGASEGFIRGSVAAAITTCCKAGVFGTALKEINPGVIGTIVAVTMNTMKNAYQVSIGKKTRTEMSTELVRDMLVSASSLALGAVGQVVLYELPVVGYLLGSFVGSVVGTFIYHAGYKAALSFCTETGVTLFGLVEQDYKLPDDIIKEMGLETFEFESFTTETFEPESFSFDTFETEKIQPDSLGITMLRRGVIGVSRIGYVE